MAGSSHGALAGNARGSMDGALFDVGMSALLSVFQYFVKIILAHCHPEAWRRVSVLPSGDPSPSLRMTMRRNSI
jgi:hypothetical protein